MPGIFVQTVTFGALTTGVGLAEDLQKGLIDRFRSLPIARSAVLVGRTWADLVRNVFVVLLMAVVGFLVGWRISTNFLGLDRRARCSSSRSRTRSRGCSRSSGSSRPDAETAQAASFPILAPLVFASSAFVPVELDAGLAPGVREAPAGDCGRERGAAPSPSAGRPSRYVIEALAWIVGIIVICAPLAVRRYRRAT